jgi:hypothetical protein
MTIDIKKEKLGSILSCQPRIKIAENAMLKKSSHRKSNPHALLMRICQSKLTALSAGHVTE